MNAAPRLTREPKDALKHYEMDSLQKMKLLGSGFYGEVWSSAIESKKVALKSDIQQRWGSAALAPLAADFLAELRNISAKSANSAGEASGVSGLSRIWWTPLTPLRGPAELADLEDLVKYR